MSRAELLNRIDAERLRQFNLPGSEYDARNTPNDWVAIATHYLCADVRRGGTIPDRTEFEDSCRTHGTGGRSEMTKWRVVGQDPQGPDEIKDSLLDTLRPILQRDTELEREKALREKFPALQSAWENYRMILEICRSNNPELPVEDEEGASR